MKRDFCTTSLSPPSSRLCLQCRSAIVTNSRALFSMLLEFCLITSTEILVASQDSLQRERGLYLMPPGHQTAD
ncbi:hypothetical protein NPIL_62881 [Nephila pilipes]|uniref:Uncharacterized protein n=1 Tax=Nephila pilipes TaxID=299642 RepID=A0A8X6J016_NEPPI|nr:hypothetical protein NPIL_62881 [Nephila pilipes]